MKVKLAIILIILLAGFLASRIRFEESATVTSSAPQAIKNLPVSAQTPPTAPAENTAPVTHETPLFNLDGEWRGILEPLHGSHLDPRDWNLELKFNIYDGQARVYIRRGAAWQEVKPGRFTIIQHKTNAIIHSIDSGEGWVESWVFSLSRHDRDSINIYGNRIINNLMQPADAESRISYGATGRFKRVYERRMTDIPKKSRPLNDTEIAAQIQEALERGKRLSGNPAHGTLSILNQRIHRETKDSAVLLVRYRYDGVINDNTWISATTYNAGKNTGFWSYRPVKLQHGEHEALIHVGMSSDSPDKYCSDSFVIKAYVAEKGGFFEKLMPYQRCWSKK